MLVPIFTLALIQTFNPSSLLETPSKAPVPVIRTAKVHYILQQRWMERDANGQIREQEDKVCEADGVAPVVELGDEDGIPSDAWHTAECVAEAKPLARDAKAEKEKVHVKLDFFVVFMNLDIFGGRKQTKNFLTFVRPDGLRDPATGFASVEDLKLSSMSYPTRSIPKSNENIARDKSEYIVSVRFED